MNTLFPSSLYRKFGVDAFVAEYRKVYDRLDDESGGAVTSSE